MYEHRTIADGLRERLEALEQELGRPIRVLRTSSDCPWSPELPDAQERGITVYLSRSPSGVDRYTDFNFAEGPHGPWASYEALVPITPPAAPIMCENNLIGEVDDRTVYDYIGLHQDLQYQHDGLHEAIVEAIKLSVDPEFASSAEMRRREAEQAALERYVRSTMNAQLMTQRNEIDGLSRNITDYQRNIATWAMELREKQQLLDAMLLVQQNDGAEQALREWQLLGAHPRAQSLRFTEGELIITTTPDLRLTRPDGESRWLGAFEITIKLDGLEIHLANLNTKRGGRDHPHVVNGRPCFGGHDNQLYELLGRGELYTVFELILQYLETLNINDEYGRYGAFWFDVEDEQSAEAVVA